jgi:hypothetical protein
MAYQNSNGQGNFIIKSVRGNDSFRFEIHSERQRTISIPVADYQWSRENAHDISGAASRTFHPSGSVHKNAVTASFPDR